MKISTKVTLEICDEIGVYREVERHSYEHHGDVALAKKGRGAQQGNTQFQQGQANTYANNASGYNTDVNNFINF